MKTGRIVGAVVCVLLGGCGSSNFPLTGRAGTAGGSSGGSAGGAGGAAGVGGSGGSTGAGGAAGTGGTGGTGGLAGTTGQGGAGGQGGATGRGGSGGGGGVAVACPATLPSNGACAAGLEGLLCSYGDAPRNECRDQARCTSGQWSIQRNQCAQPSPANQCPTTPPVGTVACSNPNRDCYYTTGAECMCLGATSSTWVCNPASNAGANCPMLIPNAGASCTTAASCSYPCGPLSTNSVTATCGAAGVWQWAVSPCAAPNG